MRGPLASRVQTLKPSATLAMTAKARQLRAEGHSVVNFAAGEPDFDTPDHIKNAAIKAIQDGFTKYTPVGGTDELREAVRTRLKADYGLEYAKDQIVVSCGAKHSLFNIFLTLLNPDDEVIIPGPYWVSYPEMVALTGAKPVTVVADERTGFKVRKSQLASVFSPKTKMLILNSPCNPTGATYTREELVEVAEVCKSKDVWVVSDEIYDKLVYGDSPYASFPTLGPDAYERTILINGVSKSYSMTGWRIGYAAGRKDVIQAASALQGQMTSNPTSIAQKAALEALRGDQSKVKEMNRAFDERRKYMHQRLTGMGSVRCYESTGAFYLFPDFSAYFGRRKDGFVIKGSTELCEYLLEQAKVVVVPGKEFGDDRCARFSYAVSMDEVRQGMDRLEGALSKLK